MRFHRETLLCHSFAMRRYSDLCLSFAMPGCSDLCISIALRYNANLRLSFALPYRSDQYTAIAILIGVMPFHCLTMNRLAIQSLCGTQSSIATPWHLFAARRHSFASPFRSPRNLCHFHAVLLISLSRHTIARPSSSSLCDSVALHLKSRHLSSIAAQNIATKRSAISLPIYATPQRALP